MATLDGYVPYATGMTARMAVEALWRAYSLPEHAVETLENSIIVFTGDEPPGYAQIADHEENKIFLWHDKQKNKYYIGDISSSARNVIWFQFA